MLREVANSQRARAGGLPAATVAAFASLLLLVFLLLACSGEQVSRYATGTPSPTPIFEGSLYTEGVVGIPQRINPLFADANPVDQDLSRLIFAGLVRVAHDGRPLPDLAPLPHISDDGRTYTFRIHPDLRWHDGAPIRSLDVAFTIDQILAPDFRGDSRLVAAWSDVEVRTPDLRTVILRLPAADASFLVRFATLPILPKHLLQGLSGDALYDAPFNINPVGAGPYRVDSITSNQATLGAYPRYHLGRPAIDRIVVRFLSDFATARLALEEGEIDGFFLRQSLNEARIASLDDLDGFVQTDLQRSVSLVLYLNNSQSTFRDARVRTAVSLALDREALVETALLGLGAPSTSTITPGTWAYDASRDSPPGDPEAAIDLLEEAGWFQSPVSGILIRQGSEFRITIRTDNDPVRIALASEIARQLEPIGIRATVASTSFTVLNRDFLVPRTYDVALAGWDQGPDPDLYLAWHSSQADSTGANIANYAGVIIDALLERGRTSFNPIIRQDAYDQFQEIWQRETPSVILAYAEFRYLQAETIETPPIGVLYSPADRFLNIHQWRIP